jgi:acyl carrier protein
MDREEILLKICQILVMRDRAEKRSDGRYYTCNLPKEVISEKTNLNHDLGFDSMDLSVILIDLEKEFEMLLNEQNLQTMSDLIDQVAEKK